jgi:hypothetical protein
MNTDIRDMNKEYNEKARAPNAHEPKKCAPVCGLGLLQKPLHFRGGVIRVGARPTCSGLGPVVSRARALVHEVTRA